MAQIKYPFTQHPNGVGVSAEKAQTANMSPGLPVAGYKPTQPQWALDLVNENKALEERVLRQIEKHAAGEMLNELDQRAVSIARTKIQEAFMWLNRGVFQPGRVKLPEDAE